MTSREFERVVHAEDGRYQLVRYDRAGKWWIEPKNGRLWPAERITVAEAVSCAAAMVRNGGKVYLDRYGGSAFSRRYRAGSSDTGGGE